MKKFIKYVSLAIFLVALGFFSMMFFSFHRADEKEGSPVAAISNENTLGKVLGEEGTQAPSQMFASQNFRTPQISFGGDAITLPSGQQADAPEISDMRSQILVTKTDRKVKFLLSWKTNKPCQSSVEYAKEGQSEGKNISEDGYGFVHSAEISPLNYSTSYSYRVSVQDKWGSEVSSEKLAFYTGAPSVSIFDLLGGAFQEMFGWAGR